MKRLVIVLVLLLLLVAASKSTPEEQYYRGVYDICTYYGLKAGHKPAYVEKACKAYTAAWVKAKRFDKTSKNWEWPLKAAERTQ